MGNSVWISVGVILVSTAVQAASNGGHRHQSKELSVGKGVFEEKCGLCHALDKSLSVRKTAEQWTATVKRMAAKSPDLISDAETEAVAAYLSEARGASESAARVPAWATPALGAGAWLAALATMAAGLLRRRLGRAIRFHKYGALAAAVLWVLHLVCMHLS